MLNLVETKPQYQSILDRSTTEDGIELIKQAFPRLLCKALDLKKVSAPIFVMQGSGLNDDLNGVERPVGFPLKALAERRAEVVQSLAKWKRLRLKQLQIPEGQGILTDMRALRPDEDLSPIHSIYVDQWDWEKHIDKKHRSIAYLRKTVAAIYQAMRQMEQEIFELYPNIQPILPEQIFYISAQDLQSKYPELDVKARENLIAKQHGAVFIMGIGADLEQGEPHDGRAPDYDDWSSLNESGFVGLNGDIIVWNPTLGRAFELSSMGIRVDKAALERQLKIRGCEERAELDFHQQILQETLPQSIGGGIGQSRLCMFLLRKAHIGEVQVSTWPEVILKETREQGIELM